MPIITWQNVPGSLNPESQAVRNASDLLARAGQNAQNILDGNLATQATIESIKQAAADRLVTEQMMSAPDSKTYAQMLPNLRQGILANNMQVPISPAMQQAIDQRQEILFKRDKALYDETRARNEYAIKSILQPVLSKYEALAVYNPDRAQSEFSAEIAKMRGSGGTLAGVDLPPGLIEGMTKNLREKYVSRPDRSLGQAALSKQATDNLVGQLVWERSYLARDNPEARLALDERYAKKYGGNIVTMANERMAPYYDPKKAVGYAYEGRPDSTLGISPPKTDPIIQAPGSNYGVPASQLLNSVRDAAASVDRTMPRTEFDTLLDAAVTNNIKKVAPKGKTPGYQENDPPANADEAAARIARRFNLQEDPASIASLKSHITEVYKAGNSGNRKLNWAQAAEGTASLITPTFLDTGNDLGKNLDYKGFFENWKARQVGEQLGEATKAWNHRNEVQQLSKRLLSNIESYAKADSTLAQMDEVARRGLPGSRNGQVAEEARQSMRRLGAEILKAKDLLDAATNRPLTENPGIPRLDDQNLPINLNEPR